MNLTLGIIGTAGRGDDAAKLDAAHWRMMVCISQTVATVTGATRLVSGGAAFGDHCAVELFNRGFVPELTLHLPAPFPRQSIVFAPTDAGRTTNRYHSVFTDVLDNMDPRVVRNSLVEIANAIQNPRCTVTEENGPGFAPFFVRNAKVAKDADVLLAFTFGVAGKPDLRDGGSADTMRAFLKRMDLPPGHTTGIPIPVTAYHFNLTDRVLYRL